ncbi:MAG: LysE family translocator [Lachnospiraceae bacterium]|nr:LysE family translocator [Lachnospiraceae bacterium]
MIWEYVVKGILIGLIFGVPAGAIGALTIQRTLEKGFIAGFLTGAGSSAADLLYAAVGIFGIAAISDFLTAYQNIFQIVGGVFIVVLGISILRKKEKPSGAQETKENLCFCFLSSFGTAVMNPATILSFMIAFAAFEIDGNVGVVEGAGLVLGILAGTLGWWLGLSGGVSLFRERITDRIYKWLNKILGSFMMIFGIVMMIRSVWPWIVQR